MNIDKDILAGHPVMLDKLAGVVLTYGPKAVEVLHPLFQRVFEAKLLAARPTEEEDSKLFWGWKYWEIEKSPKPSGCGEPIYYIWLRLPAGSRVRLAQKFDGDACNAPGRYNGWDYYRELSRS